MSKCIHIPLLSGALVCLCLVSNPAVAVDCSQQDITLTSQADVDNFQSLYGEGGVCDRVNGTLSITGDGISNLNGLSDLVSVYTLSVYRTSSLTNLAGLSSLAGLARLDLLQNTGLVTVDGLTALGGEPSFLRIQENDLLENLDALSNLVAIHGELTISHNPLLVDLDGLSGLSSVGILQINGNQDLNDINGLSGLSGTMGGI